MDGIDNALTSLWLACVCFIPDSSDLSMVILVLLSMRWAVNIIARWKYPEPIDTTTNIIEIESTTIHNFKVRILQKCVFTLMCHGSNAECDLVDTGSSRSHRYEPVDQYFETCTVFLLYMFCMHLSEIKCIWFESIVMKNVLCHICWKNTFFRRSEVHS